MIWLKHMLFPPEPRRLPGQRWLDIGLRTAHLIGVAGIGGGFLFALEEARWLPFWYLTLGSGVALSLLYLTSSAAWLAQLKGLAIILKVLPLAAALAVPAWRAELFVLVIVVSGLIAHAPARVRGWRWFPGPRDIRVGRSRVSDTGG